MLWVSSVHTDLVDRQCVAGCSLLVSFVSRIGHILACLRRHNQQLAADHVAALLLCTLNYAVIDLFGHAVCSCCLSWVLPTSTASAKLNSDSNHASHTANSVVCETCATSCAQQHALVTCNSFDSALLHVLLHGT